MCYQLFIQIISFDLNDRLSYFLNTHDIISKSQIGFQKNNRSTDNTFTLKTIINKHVHHTPEGRIYACFVNLKKAYDSVCMMAYLQS